MRWLYRRTNWTLAWMNLRVLLWFIPYFKKYFIKGLALHTSPIFSVSLSLTIDTTYGLIFVDPLKVFNFFTRNRTLQIFGKNDEQIFRLQVFNVLRKISVPLLRLICVSCKDFMCWLNFHSTLGIVVKLLFSFGSGLIGLV